MFQLLERLLVYADIRFRLGDLLQERLLALLQSRRFGIGGLILRAELFDFFFRFLAGFLALGDGGFQLFDIFLLADDVFLTFLNFALVGKERARVLSSASARHGAAGHDDIAVQRHDFEGISVFFRYRVGVENIVADERIAEQVADDVIIIVVILYQLGCEPHGALFVHGALNFAGVRLGTHAGHGQESDDTAVRAFQVFDKIARVVRRGGDDVLHGATERRLYGGFVFLFGADNIRKGALDAVSDVGIGLCHGQKPPDRILVPLEAVLQADIQFETVPERSELTVRVEQLLIEIVDGELHFAHFFRLFFERGIPRRSKIFEPFQVPAHGGELVPQPFFSLIALVERGGDFFNPFFRRFLARGKGTDILFDFGQVVRGFHLAQPLFVGQPLEHLDFIVQRGHRGTQNVRLVFDDGNARRILFALLYPERHRVVDFSDAGFALREDVLRRGNL